MNAIFYQWPLPWPAPSGEQEAPAVSYLWPLPREPIHYVAPVMAGVLVYHWPLTRRPTPQES